MHWNGEQWWIDRISIQSLQQWRQASASRCRIRPTQSTAQSSLQSNDWKQNTHHNYQPSLRYISKTNIHRYSKNDYKKATVLLSCDAKATKVYMYMYVVLVLLPNKIVVNDWLIYKLQTSRTCQRQVSKKQAICTECSPMVGTCTNSWGDSTRDKAPEWVKTQSNDTCLSMYGKTFPTNNNHWI